MARAIFGTSPKNEKKCIFKKFSKVTLGNCHFFFYDGIISADELCEKRQPLPL
jgi:hypothetical protein